MTNKTPEDVVNTFMSLLVNGSIEHIVDCFSEDGSIDMAGTDEFPWAGHWQGKEKLVEYFTVMPAALEMLDHKITSCTSSDSCVALTGTEHGRSRLSGKEYHAKWAWVFHITNGKIDFWDAYEDTQAFLNCRPWK